MSSSDGESESGADRREVAYRLFAAEFDDADFSYSESDEERAPNYVVTPTGARVNRLFVVGVLTEVETVSDDVLRARVVDPTGAFVLYAGQYQPDEQAFLDAAETPSFVAVTGKARTFQPDDGDRTFTSIRPETISDVDAATRDRWVVQTAEHTLDRIGHAATALSLDARGEKLTAALEQRGVDDALAAGIPIAIEQYGTTGTYLRDLRELALDAARLVAGELDEVEGLSRSPDEGETGDLSDLIGADAASDDATQTPETAAETVASEKQPADSPSTTPSGDVAGSEATGSEVTDSEADGIGEDGVTSGGDSDDVESGEDSSTDRAAIEGGEGGNDLESKEDEVGDFDPGEFELDDEEREEIESEFGTEFQSGTEVDEPGEADIDTPDPDEIADETTAERAEPSTSETDEPAGSERVDDTIDNETDLADGAVDAADAADAGATDSADDTAGDTADTGEELDDDEVEDAVIDAIEAIDDGDGADRSAVIDRVIEHHGVDAEAVEDAIQDALMAGRCYEPDDATLRSI